MVFSGLFQRSILGYEKFLKDSSFIRHYLWKYRRLVGIGLASLFVVDLLELVPPFLLKEVVDGVVERKPAELLFAFAVTYLVTGLVQGVCRYGWRMYLIRTSLFAGRDLRGKFADHLFGLSASFYDKRRIGELMSLATSDVDAVRMAIGNGFLVIADALFYMICVPVVMFWLSPKLTLLAFLPLPLIPWYVISNEKKVHSRFEKVQEQFSVISAMAQEGLGGVRVLKAFAREDSQLKRFHEAGRKYVALSLELARVQTAFGPTLDFTMSLGLVCLLFLGGKWTIQDAVTLGTFVAFQRYIQKMVWPMTAVGLGITFYQRAVASSGRLKEVLSTPSDIPDAAEPKLPAGAGPTGWKTAGKLEFRGLGFAFPGTDRKVLHDVSLTISPGERVAFVGSIGSGKSALLSLIPRLYPVGRGQLFVDDVDILEWPLAELRKQIGYVGQEVFLFSESVTENIGFGLAECLQSRVLSAAQLSSVHSDVLGLVGGYETRLGERGVNVSGGQKQRLTLARALCKEPSILVLDDALSSVDVRTEEMILSGLRSRTGRNTELIAAHRVSTVQLADRIIVMDQGRVAEQGTYAALSVKAGGIFKKICDQQLLRQRLKEDLDQYAEALAKGGPNDVKVESLE